MEHISDPYLYPPASSLRLEERIMAANKQDTQTNNLFQHVQVSFIYTTDAGAQRSGARIVKAQTIADATSQVRRDLAQTYDFFKITRSKIISNDNPQQQL